jgi:phosphoglycolate phosphatase-like HAD superfamily hydrolase
VAELARRGLKKQAYESMKTAKQHKQDWETRHAMYEAVERIKSRLIGQQQNMALFSSFVEANNSLAKMLEDVPLEKVEQVLDDIHERMFETQQVSEALASPATQAAAAAEVDDDELAAFLGDTVTRPLDTSSNPQPQRVASTSLSSSSRLLME